MGLVRFKFVHENAYWYHSTATEHCIFLIDANAPVTEPRIFLINDSAPVTERQADTTP
jgi:hypothetical protein